MKRVAIVGMANTTRDLAPWDDEDWEIWTLNEAPAKRFHYVKRVTRHFQLHPKWNYERTTNQNDPEHPDWLRAQRDFPIYMQEVDPDIPVSVRYPWEEICEKFQIDPEDDDHWKEFTSSFPYMLALAMYEEFDEIAVYGFEMGSETEYAYQRSSAHLWLGMARMSYLLSGKPKIIIPDESKLLGWGMPRYAYDMVLNLNPMEEEIDRNKFANMEEELKLKIAKAEGKQEEIQKEGAIITQAFREKIKELQEKKTDPKLKERRIMQADKDYKARMTPINQRLRELDDQKLDMNQQLNYIKGMKDKSQMNIDRYNAQVSKLTGPDKGVRIRV